MNIKLYRFLRRFNILKYQVHGDKHHKIILFNLIKMTLLKKKFFDKKKDILKTFNYYKKQNIDITTVPKATGQLREIQLANLALLKELDYVCKQNNLQYWLDGGSQLGAIRHKGFIPWDDDIDCGMLRKDYNKIFEAFKKSCRNPDIIPTIFRSKVINGNCYIKIIHKKNPYLFVDIFPFEFYNRKLSIKEKEEKTNIARYYRDYITTKTNNNLTNEELLSLIQEIQKTKILENEIINEELKPDVFWGLDFHHQWENWFYNYEDFFPLKTINFEGFELPIINNPAAFLTGVYGDYMAYPNKIGNGHNMLKFMTNEEQKVIDELIQGIKE